MDHLRVIMGFLLLLFSTTLSALQYAEARVLEDHLPNVAHNSASAVNFDSELDAVAVPSSRQNYSGPGGHVENYPGISSENSTHAANNTMVTVELLHKEATRPGDDGSSNVPTGIKEAATVDGNADASLHEMLSSHSSPGIGHIIRVNGRGEGNILSSGQSPGVGHWKKSKTNQYSESPAKTTPNSVLSSGPSPGVGNGHTSAIAGTQSESGTFNKLPSGPSPGVGHKVTDGYTETAQESELSKKSSNIIMNILPSGPSPGVGSSATNGRNMMEKISIVESEPKKKTAFNQESEWKKKSASTLSGPSPGVGNSATNGRNTMEKMNKKDGGGMGIIQTFNKLPSGASPGVGHSYTNALLPAKRQRATASEDKKGSDENAIFHKLPGGPSPGGGHSYVGKSQLFSNAVIKNSSTPSPRDGNSSMNIKLKLASRSHKKKKKVEQSGGALDLKIGCDGVGLDFYVTPSPPMFGIAAIES